MHALAPTLALALLLPAAAEPRFRLSFGSCNKHDKPQPFWPFLASRRPTMFAWLGDIIYADQFFLRGAWHVPGTMQNLEDFFRIQKQLPEYRKFADSVPKVIGTWDDHDWGNNNGDKTLRWGQHESQYLWNFLDEPADSPRRKQSGVWSSHVAEAAGRRIRVILLDNRSHMDPYAQPFNVSSSPQDMLGEEQWAWLEAELRHTRADVTIIGSGLQILAEDKRPAEGYFQFPGSQARLISLLSATNTSHAVFISGDVHLAELSGMQCDALAYPLFDLTSSGLTHAWNYWLHALAIALVVPGTRRIGPLYLDRNVGEIDITWDTFDTDAALTFRVFGADGPDPKLQHTVPLHDLRSLNYAAPAHVLECARAPLHGGLPDCCRRVLETCSGQFGLTGHLHQYLGSLVTLTLLFALLTALIGAPVFVFALRHTPGTVRRSAVAAALVAAIIHILSHF